MSWPPPIQWTDPRDEDLQVHLKAYQSARHYHVTSKVNLPKVLAKGLDPKEGGNPDGTTAKQAPNLLPTVSDKVHVGGDIATAVYYERQQRVGFREETTLRVFLTPEQKDTLRDDIQDSDNYAYWTDIEIPASQIMSAQFKVQKEPKLLHLFGIVALHYPTPKPPPDIVMKWHFIALEKGLLKRDAKVFKGSRSSGYESD